jgi:hypothetical protein
MSDTFSGLIDKLITVNLKISHSQNTFENINKSSLQDYKSNYFNEQGAAKIWQDINKLSDLFLQKNQLISEISEKFNEMMLYSKLGEDLDSGKFIQRKHKTY